MTATGSVGQINAPKIISDSDVRRWRVILQSEFHGHGGDSAAIKVNALGTHLRSSV
jgi:hypothetical protein